MSVTIKKEFGNIQRKPDLTSLVYGKVPPQAPEFEEAVLGACMLEREAFEETIAILPTEDCFYVDAHQKIFLAMKELYSAGGAIDLLTVTEQLRKAKSLELIGGAYKLTMLTSSVISSAHVVTHSRIIMEKYIQRELIRVCGCVISSAYEDSTDVFDLMDQLHVEYSAITELVTGGADDTVGKVFIKVVQDIDFQRKNHSVLTGIDTGLSKLNAITNGWQNTDLIIIGGRPSKGKTALGLNLALNAAISEIVQKRNVGIFSLEMGNKQLVQRLCATVTKIPFEFILNGRVTEEQFILLNQYTTYFSNLPIRVDDKTFSFLQISAKARKWKKKYNIQLIVIDYLQLIRGEKSKNGNREQEISSISRGLKLLAKELEIPIILLSQLNRGVETRKPPEPVLSDLRESGAIEQDADIVMFPWHELNENNEYKNWITVAKNRNGTLDKLEVSFIGGIQKWQEVEFIDSQFREMRSRDNPRSGIRTVLPPEIEDEEAPF